MQNLKLSLPLRLAVLCTAVLLTFVSLPVRASALEEPEELSSKACMIYNPENDEVLYAKNADATIYPASTVKIMTGILAYEHYAGNPDKKITVTKEALRGLSGNHLGLEPGETLTARDLLYAMLLAGANDAALVLAYDAGGSIAAFVTQMNAKAKELGAENTFFTNPTGLHDNSMLTTVHDLVKIAAYAAQNKDFLEMTSALQHTIPASGETEERILYNRNHLLTTRTYTKYYYSLAKGMNAGSTTQAGNCLVSTARKDGITYICAVMGAPYDEENNYNYAYSDAKKLFTWAFENYGYQKIVDTTTMIYELPVTLSANADYVTLLPEKTVELFLPNDADIASEVTLQWRILAPSAEAPVREGDIAGILLVRHKGVLVATVNLVTKGGVSRSTFLYILSIMEDIVTNGWFILGVCTVLAVTVWFILTNAKRRGRRQARASRSRARNTKGRSGIRRYK